MFSTFNRSPKQQDVCRWHSIDFSSVLRHAYGYSLVENRNLPFLPCGNILITLAKSLRLIHHTCQNLTLTLRTFQMKGAKNKESKNHMGNVLIK